LLENIISVNDIDYFAKREMQPLTWDSIAERGA